MDMQESLKRRGSVGGLPLRPNYIGIPKEGPTLSFEFQKKPGLRLREEGVKKVLLWDTTG